MLLTEKYCLQPSYEILFSALKWTDFYAPEYDSGLLWNDKDVNVEWPLEGIEEIILSEKDKKQKTLKELDIPFIYEG